MPALSAIAVISAGVTCPLMAATPIQSMPGFLCAARRMRGPGSHFAGGRSRWDAAEHDASVASLKYEKTSTHRLRLKWLAFIHHQLAQRVAAMQRLGRLRLGPTATPGACTHVQRQGEPLRDAQNPSKGGQRMTGAKLLLHDRVRELRHLAACVPCP